MTDGKAEAVLVKSLSRIARSNLLLSEVVSVLKQYGAEIISMDEDIILGQQGHL